MTRAHGGTGAFVSKWIINKSDLSVVAGSDLIQTVNLWNGSGFAPSTTAAFGRFCSGDLPALSAFYNAATGLRSTERIYMNGEEVGAEGRAFAHIVTGPNAGMTYELPYLGKFSWENSVANPTASDKTIVIGTDDASPGQVYVYIGNKQATGNEIEKAGLNNGKLFGVKVDGAATENRTLNIAPGSRFSLFDFGFVQNTSGAQLNSNSNANGVTNFLRPEDGAWNPLDPRDFYFATTDRYDAVSDGVGTQVGNSRLWRLRFDDIANPESGGIIEAVLNGTSDLDVNGNPAKVNMLDNLTIDKYGNILLQEDVGNQARSGKIWQYNIASDRLTLLAQHDPARFGNIGLAATPPFNQDEESFGIIDAGDLLGEAGFC